MINIYTPEFSYNCRGFLINIKYISTVRIGENCFRIYFIGEPNDPIVVEYKSEEFRDKDLNRLAGMLEGIN